MRDRWSASEAAGNIGLLIVLAADVLVLIVAFGVSLQPWSAERVTGAATALGAIGAFGAVVAAVFQLRGQRDQLQEQREAAAWASSRDSFWKHTEAWDKLRPERRSLNAKLLWGKFDETHQDEDADAVLAFFDGLAYFWRGRHIDARMCWFWFYDDAEWAWGHLEEYVKLDQKRDLTLWAEIEPWLKRLREIQAEETERLKRLCRVRERGPDH